MSHINFISSKRRTVRRFLGGSIEPDALRDILETALKAPTARNRRATYFVVIEDKEKLNRLSQCKPTGASAIGAGALAIAVCSDTTRAARPYVDCAIAASYIQLAVTDLDLGSCWVHVNDSLGAEAFVKAELGIPKDDAVLCLIAIGIPKDEDLEPRKEEIEWERVFIDHFEDRNITPGHE
ncbi:nitroreductase family protein [Porphyromonas sp.]|uniref:nitroreductase family protein n=1 Tax=Porphyromonas sp. TaxID=1924944 RepID=UPI0026DA82A4|nr:nitroreductase family protein [Porphyromonas sp.]MDO4771838.1 nitroreductase family protein [Porphyromonas sp.]